MIINEYKMDLCSLVKVYLWQVQGRVLALDKQASLIRKFQ